MGFRRFGKSLFLDTLKELFEGNEPLFRRLHVHDKWDWSVKYPVIKISFADGVLGSQSDLQDSLDGQLFFYEPGYGLTSEASIRRRFADLIRNIYLQTGHCYRKNELAGFEGFYTSLFYSYFAALGMDITVEDSTNRGRIDMTVRFEGQIYLFEFKVVELTPAGRAIFSFPRSAWEGA